MDKVSDCMSIHVTSIYQRTFLGNSGTFNEHEWIEGVSLGRMYINLDGGVQLVVSWRGTLNRIHLPSMIVS